MRGDSRQSVENMSSNEDIFDLNVAAKFRQISEHSKTLRSIAKMNIFHLNPMMVSCKSCRSKDEGVNLPLVNVEDMRTLLKVIITGSSIKQTHEKMNGIRFAAKTLHITLMDALNLKRFQTSSLK